jgi:hypothetical protein
MLLFCKSLRSPSVTALWCGLILFGHLGMLFGVGGLRVVRNHNDEAIIQLVPNCCCAKSGSKSCCCVTPATQEVQSCCATMLSEESESKPDGMPFFRSAACRGEGDPSISQEKPALLIIDEQIDVAETISRIKLSNAPYPLSLYSLPTPPPPKSINS